MFITILIILAIGALLVALTMIYLGVDLFIGKFPIVKWYEPVILWILYSIIVAFSHYLIQHHSVIYH